MKTDTVGCRWQGSRETAQLTTIQLQLDSWVNPELVAGFAPLPLMEPEPGLPGEMAKGWVPATLKFPISAGVWSNIKKSGCVLLNKENSPFLVLKKP